eukprot:scaffold1239_cov175-Pinguiococcus_pyrenoidosus.AAC.36
MSTSSGWTATPGHLSQRCGTLDTACSGDSLCALNAPVVFRPPHAPVLRGPALEALAEHLSLLHELPLGGIAALLPLSFGVAKTAHAAVRRLCRRYSRRELGRSRERQQRSAIADGRCRS